MALGTVIRSFASPGNNPAGITWDGRSIWHSDRLTDRIYQIDPVSGAVIRDFAAPAAVSRGLTWDGRTLWVSDANANRFYQMLTDGTVIRSFAAAAITNRGIAWDGRTLWSIVVGANAIQQIDPESGSVLHGIALPVAIQSSGLTFVGHDLYVSSELPNNTLYHIDVGGTLIRSAGLPGSVIDVTWDGRTIWAADETNRLLSQVMIN